MGAGGAESATYTFLFTDVEGSTRRWQEDPDGMRAPLGAHDQVLTVSQALDEQLARQPAQPAPR